jgi:hypothetical protein
MTTNPAHTTRSSDMMTTMIDPMSTTANGPALRLRRRQRRGGRLWQLPQTSIQEYAQYIQTKPLSDQSTAEQKFLWKFQRRLLVRRNKLPTERMRDYIGRLEQQETKSAVEAQLVQQFHRRAARRKERIGIEGQRPGIGVPPPIFWRRNAGKPQPPQKTTTTPTPTPTPQPKQQQPLQQQQPGEAASSGVLNMASLRESMDKMGLNTDKLREATMEDAK